LAKEKDSEDWERWCNHVLHELERQSVGLVSLEELHRADVKVLYESYRKEVGVTVKLFSDTIRETHRDHIAELKEFERGRVDAMKEGFASELERAKEIAELKSELKHKTTVFAAIGGSIPLLIILAIWIVKIFVLDSAAANVPTQKPITPPTTIQGTP